MPCATWSLLSEISWLFSFPGFFLEVDCRLRMTKWRLSSKAVIGFVPLTPTKQHLMPAVLWAKWSLFSEISWLFSFPGFFLEVDCHLRMQRWRLSSKAAIGFVPLTPTKQHLVPALLWATRPFFFPKEIPWLSYFPGFLYRGLPFRDAKAFF